MYYAAGPPHGHKILYYIQVYPQLRPDRTVKQTLVQRCSIYCRQAGSIYLKCRHHLMIKYETGYIMLIHLGAKTPTIATL